jgi:type I site-specific restriction endonuclease
MIEFLRPVLKLAAKRFRRICFVVDRNALGQQAEAEFRSTKVVSVKTFADIFGLKGLSDVAPESETKVHICTIQGLVKRVLFAEDNAEAPAVDQYDLVAVDECHRGYLLDREMADTELEFRSQDDYVSKYRRVLEYARRLGRPIHLNETRKTPDACQRAALAQQSAKNRRSILGLRIIASAEC